MSRSERIVVAVVVSGGVGIVLAGAILSQRHSSSTPLPLRKSRPPGLSEVHQSETRAQVPGGMAESEGRAGSLAGLVRASNGEGISGAEVKAYTFDGRPRVAGEGVAGPQGSFVISRLSPGTYTLRASHGGMGTRVREGVEVFPDRTIQIEPLVLVRGIDVTMIVSADVPLPEVRLALFVDFKKSDRNTYSVFLQEARSGADGQILLPGLADGVYRFTLEKQGYGKETDSFEIKEGRVVEPFRLKKKMSQIP